MTLAERFWSKVQKTDSCWLWTAHRQPKGYGTFRVGREGHRLAHRVAYELSVGPIPAGLQLDHLCRNRSCVNPAHLEPVTSRTNTLRGDTIPARNAAKTHCRRGHVLAGDNLLAPPPHIKRRTCRECHRAAVRACDARRRWRAAC